jgi:hypothetical protein
MIAFNYGYYSLNFHIYNSMTSTRCTNSPQTTENNLLDIINWLKEGDYVVIHNNYKYGRYFHSQCNEKEQTDDEIKPYLENTRIIYVNVSHLPGLLDDGEWNWYINQEGNQECKCQLKTRFSNPNGLPHSYHLKLGFGRD